MNKFWNIRLLLISATLLTAFTGCRFGNYSEPPKPLSRESDFRSIELFFTNIKNFTTKVALNSLNGPDMVLQSNSNAPLSSVPTSILNVMTNPVYFAVPTNSNLFPIFRDNRDTISLTTQLDSSGNISLHYIPSDGPFIFWDNPNCITNFEINQTGILDRSNPSQIQYENGTVVPVAGNVSMTYTFTRVIDSINGTSNCDDDLSRLANCYENGTGCSSEELSASRSLFDLYIRQTGVLKIEDATKIKALEYIVQYE
jgi:hypothetical protein